MNLCGPLFDLLSPSSVIDSEQAPTKNVNNSIFLIINNLLLVLVYRKVKKMRFNIFLFACV